MPSLKVRALVVKDGSGHASSRTAGEVEKIFEEVNRIWSQADLKFRATVSYWRPDPRLIEEVVAAASRREGDVEALGAVTGAEPREITAIYVRSIGGSSGKVFRPKKTVVVTDEAKVSVSRTTAHEIGHLFDLEHWIGSPPPGPPDRPPNQLMARTQLGTLLTPDDIAQVKKALPVCGLDWSKDESAGGKI